MTSEAEGPPYLSLRAATGPLAVVADAWGILPNLLENATYDTAAVVAAASQPKSARY
jgi:hypothetical protein